MRLSLRSFLGIAGFVVALVAPSTAWGNSQVRFIHAVPNLGAATLTAAGSPVGTAGFGQASTFSSVPSGNVHFVVSLGGKPALDSEQVLSNGRSYTVVAMGGKQPQLQVFEDGKAKAGVARLRVIHAAPELGKPDLTVDGKSIAKHVLFTSSTRYWGFSPGDHTLRVTKPGSGKPVIAPAAVPLAAGTDSTVLVVGSQGERVRPVLVTDSQDAPTSAPATGLGGLSLAPGPDWSLAMLAALVAGASGLGAHRLLTARRRRATRA